MNDFVSQELQEKYKDEWLLFEVLKTDASQPSVETQLIWHGKDRKEAYRKVEELDLKRFQILFSGDLVPEGYEVALWLS